MIPKKIHYIWLGGKPLDKISQNCIQSWKEHLSDYEICCWDDEKCFSIINGNTYAKEAYEKKKFAFVSDYLRLYVLYYQGGLYMDTDVKVLRNLDNFLHHGAFTCFENKEMIPTALLGAEKGNGWIEKLLLDYENLHFLKEDGQCDFTTNVMRISAISSKCGFIPNGKYQIFDDNVHIYPKEYFCPLDTLDSKNNCFTENTYAVHLYNGSWTPMWRRRTSKIKKALGLNPEKILGERLYNKLKTKY